MTMSTAEFQVSPSKETIKFSSKNNEGKYQFSSREVGLSRKYMYLWSTSGLFNDIYSPDNKCFSYENYVHSIETKENQKT